MAVALGAGHREVDQGQVGAPELQVGAGAAVKQVGILGVARQGDRPVAEGALGVAERQPDRGPWAVDGRAGVDPEDPIEVLPGRPEVSHLGLQDAAELEQLRVVVNQPEPLLGIGQGPLERPEPLPDPAPDQVDAGRERSPRDGQARLVLGRGIAEGTQERGPGQQGEECVFIRSLRLVQELLGRRAKIGRQR